MSDNPSANRLKALDMVAHLTAGADGLAPDERTMLEDSLEQDLDAATQNAVRDEERLQKMEGQVHALSEAVIAIAAPSNVVDAAVQTVKDRL